MKENASVEIVFAIPADQKSFAVYRSTDKDDPQQIYVCPIVAWARIKPKNQQNADYEESLVPLMLDMGEVQMDLENNYHLGSLVRGYLEWEHTYFGYFPLLNTEDINVIDSEIETLMKEHERRCDEKMEAKKEKRRSIPDHTKL